MNEMNFNLLRDLAEKQMTSIPGGAAKYEELLKKKYIDSKGITKEGLEYLENHKVNNAIIMAAGYSARCMPLSNVMPKGLFKIKGKILIEREIEQLLSAGIDSIIVVTGFMADKFEYLKNKYGVILIYNKDYDKYNNMSSLYAASEYIDRSYILCSDNYYEDNVFHKYVYDSYYSCVYSEDYCDEFCVTETDVNGYITDIHRGGKKAWYTIGDAYFNKSFSDTFKRYMQEEWDNHEIRNLLMDDFHIKHIKELPLKAVQRDSKKVLEFDTLQEIIKFDESFQEFMDENLNQDNTVIKVFSKYSNIESYHSVPTEQISGRLHLNENLFKPSPKCLEVLRKITMEDLYLYDLTHKDELIDEIAIHNKISSNNIFIHNGSSEVIKSIFSILLNEKDTVLIPTPGWSYYKSVADTNFAKCITYQVTEEKDEYHYDLEDILVKAKKYQPKIIVITSPHMPTGCEIGDDDLEKIIIENENSIIMLDQAYWGYERMDSEFEKKIITQYSNVVITRTFSKFYGLANIRIGYGLCSYPLRRTIGLDLPLFRSAIISRKMAIQAIKDREYYSWMREETKKVREWFIREANNIANVHAYNSKANFVFLKIDNTYVERVRAFMEENNILVRLFTDKDNLKIRITIGPKDLMERVIYQLKKITTEG